MLLLLASTENARAADTGVHRASPVIFVELDSLETPEPTCSVCSIVVKPPGGADVATMVILNYGAHFEGDVELRVLLETEEWTSVWIPGVTIGVDGIAEVELEVDWSWEDVRLAWTSFYPMH
ncbi:MAG: hypothetical protein AAGF11_09545 [Myxococcota bacterium]